MKSFYSLNKKAVMVSTLSLLLLGTISCGSEKASPSNDNNPSDIPSETTLTSSDNVILSRILLTNQTQHIRMQVPNSRVPDLYTLEKNSVVESVVVPADTVITNENVDEVFASGLQVEVRSVLDNTTSSYAVPYRQNYQRVNPQIPTQRRLSRQGMNPNDRFSNPYTINALPMMFRFGSFQNSLNSFHRNSFVSNHSNMIGSQAMQQQFSANFNINNNFPTLAAPMGYTNTSSSYSSSIEEILNSDSEECTLEGGCLGFVNLNSTYNYSSFRSVEDFANAFWSNTGFNYKLQGSSTVEAIALPTASYFSESSSYSYAVFSATSDENNNE